MGFFDKVGDWWGDVSGSAAKKAGKKEFARGSETLGAAGAGAAGIAGTAGAEAGRYGAGTEASMGADAADYMKRANLAAQGQAAEEATQGSRQALQAARGSGLNKGQSALAGAQQAGDIYSGALTGGRQQYMQGTREFAGQQQAARNAQLGATGLQANIGGLQQSGGLGSTAAGQAQGAGLWGGAKDIAGAAGNIFGLGSGKAEGAIITEPTPAVIGEKGPEAVVPLAAPNLDAILRKLKSVQPAAQVAAVAPEAAPSIAEEPLTGPLAAAPAKPADPKLDMIIELAARIKELQNG